VRTASLRRFWPDRIELTVVEHQPLARWGEDGLVSLEGIVFRPPASELPGALPMLMSHDNRAPELTHRYQAWKPRFAEHGLDIERIRVDARGAWTVDTNAGFDLALGTMQIEERVSRFLNAWPLLAAAGRFNTVDMRYSNGIAVVWEEESNEEPTAVGTADTAPMEETNGRLSGSEDLFGSPLRRSLAHPPGGPFPHSSAHGPRFSRS
jgi:cell division protein FtsQ